MTDNGHILGVVFDLDDTLLAERDYVRSGYAAVAAHLRRWGANGEPFESWLWQRFLAGQSDGALDALNVRFELGLSGEGIDELVRVYREHEPALRAAPGMPGFLGLLHQRCRLGLLSDGFLPAQRLKLRAVRLERFFDAVVFTEELGRSAWKPAPHGYEQVAAMLDLPHRACAYVADNPSKDFLAPNRLGWRTVQLLRPGQVHTHKKAPAGGSPQHVVRSLEELAAALR